MCVSVCLHVYLCTVYIPDAHGDTDTYEPPCECWESNMGPLEEQPVLLTTEPFLRLGPRF